MVGGGINDTPALPAAYVGVAMKGGSDIAWEEADISLRSIDLRGLVDLKNIALGIIDKNKKKLRFIICFNTALLILGAG